eukprot:NODE_54_length_26799_cov_0.554794.p8 type:complete len:310 gc:universal NODE_54_length_26799_cov_0.554794:21722-22651(+)
MIFIIHLVVFGFLHRQVDPLKEKVEEAFRAKDFGEVIKIMHDVNYDPFSEDIVDGHYVRTGMALQGYCNIYIFELFCKGEVIQDFVLTISEEYEKVFLSEECIKLYNQAWLKLPSEQDFAINLLQNPIKSLLMDVQKRYIVNSFEFGLHNYIIRKNIVLTPTLRENLFLLDELWPQNFLITAMDNKNGHKYILDLFPYALQRKMVPWRDLVSLFSLNCDIAPLDMETGDDSMWFDSRSTLDKLLLYIISTTVRYDRELIPRWKKFQQSDVALLYQSLRLNDSRKVAELLTKVFYKSKGSIKCFKRNKNK